jgi:hypothetical protein
MSAEDALRFLGRKPNGHYQGEATADLKRRPEGVRVKFRMKRNSIKMYDKWSVLRTETTIDNPREFKTLRRVRGSLRWMRMAKGVANFWRLNQLGQRPLSRGPRLHSTHAPGSRRARPPEPWPHRRPQTHRPLQPVSPDNARLFAAALHGRHLLNGFRNRDLAALLDSHSATTDVRRCRAKVTRSRLYRVTPRGHRLMSALLTFRQVDFPQAFAAAA